MQIKSNQFDDDWMRRDDDGKKKKKNKKGVVKGVDFSLCQGIRSQRDFFSSFNLLLFSSNEMKEKERMKILGRREKKGLKRQEYQCSVLFFISRRNKMIRRRKGVERALGGGVFLPSVKIDSSSLLCSLIKIFSLFLSLYYIFLRYIIFFLLSFIKFASIRE